MSGAEKRLSAPIFGLCNEVTSLFQRSETPGLLLVSGDNSSILQKTARGREAWVRMSEEELEGQISPGM